MRPYFAPRTLATACLVVGLFLVLADPALAQTTSSTAGNIGTYVTNIINLLNNNIIRGLAVLAVMAAGIAWMFGHLDLRRAGTVIIGIIVIFGAATIVDLITGASGS